MIENAFNYPVPYFSFNSEDFNEWNKLNGLNAFQHCMIICLANYIQKIFCCLNSPLNLANCFIVNSDLNKK